VGVELPQGVSSRLLELSRLVPHEIGTAPFFSGAVFRLLFPALRFFSHHECFCSSALGVLFDGPLILFEIMLFRKTPLSFEFELVLQRSTQFSLEFELMGLLLEFMLFGSTPLSLQLEHPLCFCLGFSRSHSGFQRAETIVVSLWCGRNLRLLSLAAPH